MKSVENDMMSIAKTSLQEINYMKTAIKNTNRIDFMAKRLIHLEEAFTITRLEAKLNTQGLEYLMNIVGIMIPQIERGLSQYEHITHKLEVLLDAPDNLSNGLLSHSVIRPGILQNFLWQVELNLKVHYPDYELVSDKVEHYYNLPAINFKYDNDILPIQIPLFVKHYTQHALYLYNLRAVPVPYHINARLSENMDPSSYTWLHPKHQLIAMSYSTYVPIDIACVHNCFYFGNTYFCEQVFLIQHSTKHTCESAIYYELNINMIKQLCNFTYYPSLILNPQY